MPPSHLESQFSIQLHSDHIQPPIREYRFAPPRRWRFDFAWPDHKVAAEIHGGIWNHGRHNRGSGYIKDLEKLTVAQLAGWCVLQFTQEDLDNGRALAMVKDALCL
jgi:very-short-patch-repair endonuclease